MLTDLYGKNANYHDALISRGNTYVDFGTESAFAKAQRDYEQVLLRDSANLNAHINLAFLFQMTGKYMKAWQQFTQALDINSSNQTHSKHSIPTRFESICLFKILDQFMRAAQLFVYK